MILDRFPDAGYYACVRTSGLGAWAIRRGTRSRYNHTFVTLDGKGTIIEAEPGGARIGHLGEYHADDVVFNFHEPGTREQRAKVAAFAKDLVGTPYNEIAITDDALNALGIHWRLLARIAAGDHELVCSQLAVAAGYAGGFEWGCGKLMSEVTPGDLARRPYMAGWSWA